MALPQPSGFPTPTPFPGPQPGDMFGATPDELRTLEALQISAGDPTATTTNIGTTDAHSSILEQMAGVTAGAVGPANDPLAWTPDEAAEQSETAIMKIATVNPDLAAQLQAQRTGEPETGGGFFDAVKGAIASVAGLPGISQVMDYMSRPAKVIPELLDDQENDGFWENVGQALSGNSDANWNRVLQNQFGMEKSPLTAVLGFIGDVATDPTTYLTAGLGGIGREAALRTAGLVGVKASNGGSILAKSIAARTGMTADEAASEIWKSITNVSDIMKTEGAEAATRAVSADAAGGIAGVAMRAGDQELLMEAMRVADSTMQYASRGGTFGDFGGLSDELAAQLGINREATLGVISQMRKKGSGIGVDKIAYEQAKAAQSLVGGLRFKFSLPIFNVRYVSPAIPFSNRMGFQIGRRFFSGMSGEARMQKLVEKGVPGAAEALKTWWNPVKDAGGFSAVKSLHGEVARQLSKGSFHLGGFLYPLSEQVGRLTAHFSSTTMLTRGGGLGAMMALDAKRAVSDMNGAFVADAYALKGEVDGPSQYGQPEAAAALAGGDKAAQFRYMHGGTREGLSEGEVEAIDYLRKVHRSSRRQANEYGAAEVTAEVDIEGAEAVHPSQTKMFTEGNHGEVGEGDWYVEGDANMEDWAHVDGTWRRTDPEGHRGIVLRQGIGGQKAVVRSKNPLIIDKREEGINLTPQMDPLPQYKSNARAFVESMKNATKEGDPQLQAARLAETQAAEVSRQASEAGYDSILVIDADGTKRLTMLDEANLKPVTEDAHILANNPAPLVINDNVKRALRGEAAGEELKYIGGLHRFEAKLQKDIAGKSQQEATAILKRHLEERGIVLSDETPLWEEDVLKVTDEYVGSLGRQATNAGLGRFTRRMQAMHHGGAFNLGGASHTLPQRYAPMDETIDAMMAPIRAHRDKVHAAVTNHKETNRLLNEAKILSQRLAGMREAIDEDIEHIAGGLKRKVGKGVTPAIHGLEGRDLTKMLGDDAGEHYFHVGRYDDIDNIADEGLRTYAPWQHSDQQAWTDGLNDNRSFWSDPDKVNPVWGGDRPIIYRAKRDETFHRDVRDDVYRSDHTPTRDLEYLGEDGKWHPVAGRSSRLEEVKLEGKALKDWQDKIDSIARQRQREMEKGMADMDEALNEHRKLIAEMHVKSAQVQPALRENAGNLAGFAEVQIPGLKGIHLPAFMAVELNQAARGFKRLGDFQAEWRRFTGVWKTWATWMNPGFHMRNIQGAWFNNLLGGVGVHDYVMATRIRKAASELRTSGKGKWSDTDVDKKWLKSVGLDFHFRGYERVTYGDIADLQAKAGISSSNMRVFNEARIGSEELNRAANQRQWIEKGPVGILGRRYAKRARQAGDLTENLFRSAAWIRGMKNTGGDVMGARAFTMMRHGDYAELTDWEYGFVRDLIPFYKWMRTNMPHQIHQLLENPGKLMAFQHAKEAGYGIMGVDFEQAMQDMPPWMQSGFSVPLPGGHDGAFTALTIDFPMSDLHKSGTEFISSFLPLIKPMVESYVYGKSTFSGAPLEGKAVKTKLFNIPGLKNVLAATGIGDIDADGDLVVDDKLQNVLSTIPLFGRFRDWIFADPDRAKLRANTAASAFFGVGLRPVDKETITNNELAFYYQHILPELEHVKSMGFVLPTKDDLRTAGVIADTAAEAKVESTGSSATSILDQLAGSM